MFFKAVKIGYKSFQTALKDGIDHSKQARKKVTNVPAFELQVGDTFGAVVKATQDVQLFCQVESIHDGKLRCYVINGAWTIIFDAKSGFSEGMIGPSWNPSCVNFQYEIIYTKQDTKKMHYNDAIIHIEKNLPPPRKHTLLERFEKWLDNDGLNHWWTEEAEAGQIMTEEERHKFYKDQNARWEQYEREDREKERNNKKNKFISLEDEIPF